MADELAKRSHALFKQAIEVEAGERRRFVDEACANDTMLRRRVHSLLLALDESSEFLESPALGKRMPPSAMAPPPLLPDRIADFTIIRVIGTGGMATVYEAMQDKPQRRVALKVMKHGLTRSASRRRFEFETEVLARLQHPGIARIYEVGTHQDGHNAAIPFFAMEYVADAQPIAQYADAKPLDVRARLAMLADVCEAVQHGHQNGVIHRDLKPGNVLVDRAGACKVIDFGIARSTDPEHAIITRESGVGQVIGTLNYMSPEQCAGDAIDVRSDVYALGMILYELLCGRLPHDLTRVPLPEAMRIVQSDPPPRPGSINPSLRGDVEAIMLKAIDKDPERRYRTVAAFGSDIRRYLRHETIEARQPTLAYQCRLFARRHRALVAAMIAIASTLLIATVVSTSLAFWAKAESKQRLIAEHSAVLERDSALWGAYTANIAAAISSYYIGEYRAMRTRLESAPVEMRGWEWNFLNELARTELQVVHAHDTMALDMAISNDQSLIVTTGWDGEARVWHAHTRAFVRELELSPSLVMCAAFSPDDEVIACGLGDGTVRLFNTADGRVHKSFAASTSRINSIEWLDEQSIIIAGESGEASVWNTTRAECSSQMPEQPGGVKRLALSPDRSRCVTVNDDGVVWIRTGDGLIVLHEHQFDAEPSRIVQGVAFSDDGRRVAVSGENGRVNELDVLTGEVLRQIKIPNTQSLVRALAYSPDSSTLAAGVGDRTIVVWNVATTAPIARHLGHDDAITRLHFDDDGQTLMSISLDGTLRAWDMSDDRGDAAITTLAGHNDRLRSVAFSPDGRLIATASNDHRVRLWSADTNICLHELEGHEDEVFDVAFSPGGTLLASTSMDDTVRIWNVQTGRFEREMRHHNADVWSVAFSPDGRWLASGGDDHVVRVRDVRTGATVHDLAGHDGRIISVRFSPDGSMIASTSRDHDVILWNALSGAILHRLQGHRLDVFASAFSHDGRTLYTGCRDRTVRIWNTFSGECEDVLEGHGQWITGLSLSPDGTRLAGSSWFGEMTLWDTATHDVVASFKAHATVVRDIAFDATGDRLATASYDGTVRMHDSAASRRLTDLGRE